ncbi:FAD-dependent oxidoreductase [Lactiplantibacillus xiangfangensis]|uniref:Urocanate reductase n=1 Tax=Lactiplantibacillus xiangfangensis TaxID=942150 RepID=A0A0R2MD79_9LACO|nr:FAD-dependent oxidoreductase [Lactiplantibacillus xiangfangensis]KRO11654.1 flavoprotein [Lactiplantibacillus xiangfangensis]
MTKKFIGAVQGFHGVITATVTVDDHNKLIDVTTDTPAGTVGALGIQQMQQKMKAVNNADVDAVSGASVSSNSFKNAVKKALAVSSGRLTAEEATDLTVDAPDQLETTDATTGASANPEETPSNPSPVIPAVAYQPDLTFDASYDVVVVGAGGAGLAAAAEAARSGLSVYISEKSGIPGGTTNYSGGVIQAAGTALQKKSTDYPDDTPAKHAKLWLQAGENTVDPELVKDLANGAPKNIDWLADLGIHWISVYGHCQIPYVDSENFADRIHVYDNGTGTGGGMGDGLVLTQTLLKAALKAGATIHYETPAIALVQDATDHTVYGVKVTHDGQSQLIRATRGVILATASIDHNPALAKAYSPQHYNDLMFNTCLSAKTDTGDGLLMGLSAGAAVSGMGGTIDFCGKTGNGTSNQIPTIPLVFVNGAGRRFVCEDATYAYEYRAIFQQEKQLGKPTYMIFGQNSIHEPGSVWTDESLASDVKDGVVKRADSIEALAKLIDVPAANLEATISTWNENVSHGTDLEFGRKTGLKPLLAPFYAYHNQATNLGALGGLTINVDGQVLNNFKQPITGLYAAGLNAGGWIGPYYPGSGTAISGIVHQGRKAAQALVNLK